MTVGKIDSQNHFIWSMMTSISCYDYYLLLLKINGSFCKGHKWLLHLRNGNSNLCALLDDSRE